MHTPTFWHLSEGKWHFYSKIIYRIHVIFLIKAAKLKQPMSTKSTHLLFDIFQKTNKDIIKKFSSCPCNLFIQSSEAKTVNEHKIHTPTFWHLSECIELPSKVIFKIFKIHTYPCGEKISAHKFFPIFLHWNFTKILRPRMDQSAHGFHFLKFFKNC